MKFCPPHYDQLKQGVKDRGMWQLVAGSGKEAMAIVVRQMEGDEHPGFDPLMAATWAMYAQALRFGGLAMMEGEHCPLCEADAHGGHAQEWIDGCLDAQLEHARALGLVPKVQ